MVEREADQQGFGWPSAAYRRQLLESALGEPTVAFHRPMDSPARSGMRWRGLGSGPARPRLRMFDGKPYLLLMVSDMETFENRQPAALKRGERVAERIRAFGNNARVVKWKGQVGIYAFQRDRGNPLLLRDFLRVVPPDDVLYPRTHKPDPAQWSSALGAARWAQRERSLVDNPVVFNYRIRDNGTSTRAYEARPKRPPLLVIGEGRLPMEMVNDYSSNYGAAGAVQQLDTEQRRGIDMMVTALLDTDAKGFLLADGTGFGKTRQMLVAADAWRRGKETPVLIITENKETIADSFTRDAGVLGIDLEDFDVTTYSELGGRSARGKRLAKKKYGLVIYDEAHNLKNIKRPTSLRVREIEAEKAVFATATPLDSPGAGAYFLSKVTGVDEHVILRDLGLEWVYYPVWTNDNPRLLSKKPTAEIVERLDEYRKMLMENGLMMRRVHPFYGDIISSSIEMDDAMRTEQQNIQDWWGQQTHSVASPGSAGGFRYAPVHGAKGQASLELGRWEEGHKVTFVYDKLQESLRDGKQVVLALSTSGDQVLKGLSWSGRIKDYHWRGPGAGDAPIAGFEEKSSVESRIDELNRLHGRDTGLKPLWRLTYPRGLESTGGVASDGEPEGRWYVGRKGAAQMVKEMLERDGISYSELTQHRKGAKEVQDFQSGKNRVMVMTPQSGATGINLDDTVGDSPRHLIIASKGWQGDKLEQVIGRVSRKTTMSPSLGEFVGLREGWADNRQNEILERKLRSLRAMTGSGDEYEKLWAPTVAKRARAGRLDEERLVEGIA